MNHRFRFQLLALTMLVVLLAGCAAPTTPAPTQAPAATNAPPEPTAAPTAEPEPTAAEPVTLTFWWEGAAVGNLEIFQASFDRFEALHPNVTIEVVAIPFEDMLRTMPLALDAGTGPDIAMSLPLESITFPAAKAGHLLDLSDIAQERGWLDHYDTKALEVNNRGLDGIFGFPYEWTVVGVYYNKDIYAQLGLEPPQSFAEFEEQLAAILAAGITPISVGARDGWPLMHVWQEVAHTNVDYALLRALEDRDPTVSYEDPAILAAAHKVTEWAELGYIDADAVAASFVDANNLFINGEVALNVGGTWVQNDFRGADFEVGFFAMPLMNPDLPPRMGGFTPANDIVIVEASPNRDWAIELLDYLLSEENMTAWWQSGLLVPYNFDPLPAGKDDLQAEIYQAMQTHGAGHFIGVSTPETARVTWAVLQEMIAGDRTPEEVFAEIQETYLTEVQ